MSNIPKPVYVMSEPHLSGYRVILGYNTLEDASQAHDAAVNALPELVALRKENERLREALCIETKGSLTWWVDRAAQYAEDMGEEGFLIDRDHWERIVFTAQTEAAHAALKERNDG